MGKHFIGSVDGSPGTRVDFELSDPSFVDEHDGLIGIKAELLRGRATTFRTKSLGDDLDSEVTVNPSNYAWWAIVDIKDETESTKKVMYV